MEQTKSFFELAEQGSLSTFEPDYTADFKVYIEDSIRRSNDANCKAITAASTLVINC